MSLRRALERSLFTLGNRLAQAHAGVECWLAEPMPSCRPLDLSELEDRVMLSASPAAQAIVNEAPVMAVDDPLPNDDPALAAESQSILLAADTPDAPAPSDAEPNGSDQVGDVSSIEAQSRSIVIDARDRIVGHYSIGYSSSNTENRMVRSDLVNLGWENFVATQIEPVLDAGFQRIMLHNPFGIPVDSETGETQIMQFEQYLAAQQELPALTEGFVQAWQPITDRGVEVIAYFGGPHNSLAMRALESDMDAWWDRAWQALQPALDAGMSIGIDNSAPRLASSTTFMLAEALRERGVRVYTEARPYNTNPLWFDYPVVARDPTWIATDPGISGQHPVVYSRFPTNDQLSNEILRIIRPNEEEDGQWSRMKQALMDGNSATVYPQDVILPKRGDMNLNELFELAGVSTVPTDIHLAGRGQVGMTYTIVAQPEHGTLTVHPGNGSVVTYTPEAGFSGTDSFQFITSQGDQQSEAGTITLSVHSLLAAEGPGDLPDPDQGTLVTPDLDGGPIVPPDTGPPIIPDSDDGEALHFDPGDLPGPAEPVIPDRPVITTDSTKTMSQPTRTTAVDLRPLNSRLLPTLKQNASLALDPTRPAARIIATQPAAANETAAGVDQTNRVNEALAPPSSLGYVAPLRGTNPQQTLTAAPQVTDASMPPDLPPLAPPARQVEATPAAEPENHSKTPTPGTPVPTQDRAEPPAVEPSDDSADDSADDDMPTASVVAAALGTATALSAAAAAHFGGRK